MNTALANIMSAGDMYPALVGRNDSTGVAGTTPWSLTMDGMEPLPTGGETAGMFQVENAMAIGMRGDPVKWYLALIALLCVTMYAGRRLGGEEGNYGSLRLSAYNIFVITLASILGTVLLKMAVTKFPVPGLTPVIMSA